MNTQTQNAKLLKDLQEGLMVTPAFALSQYGCFRLAARVYDLRKLGHVVETRLVTFGKKRFAAYYIPEQYR